TRATGRKPLSSQTSTPVAPVGGHILPNSDSSMSEKPPVATPIAKEPTVSKAPPPGRKFPCPQCGARLDFDPSARGLKCPYCGHEEVIARDAEGEVVERDYLDYLEKLEAGGGQKPIEGRSSQVRCTGCGAVVLLEDKVVTEQCPFCHTHLENH